MKNIYEMTGEEINKLSKEEVSELLLQHAIANGDEVTYREDGTWSAITKKDSVDLFNDFLEYDE